MKDALLIVDMQRDYFPGGKMELPGSEAAAARTAQLLEYFRSSAKEIYHIQHIEDDPEADFFAPKSEGVEIISALKPNRHEPQLIKHSPNSFQGTALNSMLRENGIGRLVICGAMSNMCIDATVRAAYDLGYECALIHDACAACDLGFKEVEVEAAKVHAAFMAALESIYADVLSAEEFLNTAGN